MLAQLLSSPNFIDLIAGEVIRSLFSISEEEKVAKWYAFIKIVTPHENRLKKAMREYFSEQEKVVLANMKKTPKALVKFQKDIIDSWLFPIAVWNRRLTNMVDPMLLSVMGEIGQEELAQLVSGVSFDLYDEDVTGFMEEHVPNFSFRVNEETARELRRTLAEGLEAGESIPDLRNRVQDVFNFGRKYRATRIARTETIRASNRAAEFAYMQSGVVEGKEWLIADDERTCPFCRYMDEATDIKTQSLGANFLDKGDTLEVDGKVLKLDYEDIQDPPLHVSCRCTIIPILIQG